MIWSEKVESIPCISFILPVYNMEHLPLRAQPLPSDANQKKRKGILLMKRKLLRALCYLKELLAMLLCKLLGAVCRAFIPAYRGIWLVGERGTDARDNGYWFYRYLRTQHPECRAYYVIAADSPDAAKIAALGGAVQRGSFRHDLLYYCADYLVGTHVQPCAPDLMVHYHLAAKGIRARGKQVFLQHGVTMSEMQWMHRENLYLDLFVCGAKPEYEYIRDTYGFAPEVTRYLGMARWDHLLQAGQAPCQKMILLMPTWRGSHYPEGEAFLDTPYYKAFESLLSSARLDALLEQYGYTLVFYPHIEMQKHLSRFHAPSERVVLADSALYDVQQLLLDCALLVTDHSSVFFDVAYLEKPELYYQFDEADYQKYHYQKGYFDFARDGFGPVCTTEEALLQALETALQHGMQMPPEYKARTAAFFPLRDTQNCARIYEAICGL